MHEATFKRPLSLLADPLIPTEPSVQSGTTPAEGSLKSAPFGLGLNLPAPAPKGTVGENLTSITPGGDTHPRQRSTTGKDLRMDLAGIGSLGDAASHASMIMQSRQAKLQRWRPNSAGKQVSTSATEAMMTDQQDGQEILLPPKLNRSTTTGAPAMLAAPRAGRQSQWGIHDSHSLSAASSPGEDLPPIPVAMDEISRVGSLPLDSLDMQMLDRTVTLTGGDSDTGASRLIQPATISALGMERQQSAGGSVGGVEWVDWYDCYKRYKEAKLRAEAGEAEKEMPPPASSPIIESNSPVATNAANMAAGDLTGNPTRSSPQDIDLNSNFDDSSAIALSPQTSRDDFIIQERSDMRRRSMSIRSAMSSLDPTRSPNQKRNSIFERPRQTSGSSIRSDRTDSSSSGVAGNKRKKNLVNKMEGWWNAVKSNFIPEGHQTHLHRPLRPSNLGVYPSRRVPSAPTSRRGSDMSPIATPQAALLAPETMRRESSQSLRQVASHKELRPRASDPDSQRLQAAASIVSSTSADIARLSRGTMERGITGPAVVNNSPTTALKEPSRFPSRVPSSLEARRRGQGVGASLRLELESNVLRSDPSRPDTSMPPLPHRTMSSRVLSTHSSSGTSSYGQTLYGPGLTPGVSRWDQTPSPIYPVSTVSRDEKEDRPVAPGAEITVASVRRHIKHRLNAAKEICDNTLRKAIEAMTRFADEQKERQILQAELEDSQQDYFDSISDSPLVDAEESEVEGNDVFDNGSRSRHGELTHRNVPLY